MTLFYVIGEYPYHAREHYWIHIKDSCLGDCCYKFHLIVYRTDNDYWKAILVRTEKNDYYGDDIIVAIGSEVYMNPVDASMEGMEESLYLLNKDEAGINIKCIIKQDTYIKKEIKRLSNKK